MRLTSSATGMTPFYEANENCSRGGKPRQTENSNSAHKPYGWNMGSSPHSMWNALAAHLPHPRETGTIIRPLQYFRTLRSTRSDQAWIPPVRFLTLVNPALFRSCTALAPRGPILQRATISRLESSSCTRAGNSGSGIRYPPILEVSYSCSSRTSSRKSFSPASSRCFSSSTWISGTLIVILLTTNPFSECHFAGSTPFSAQNTKPTCQLLAVGLKEVLA